MWCSSSVSVSATAGGDQPGAVTGAAISRLDVAGGDVEAHDPAVHHAVGVVARPAARHRVTVITAPPVVGEHDRANVPGRSMTMPSSAEHHAPLPSGRRRRRAGRRRHFGCPRAAGLGGADHRYALALRCRAARPRTTAAPFGDRRMPAVAGLAQQCGRASGDRHRRGARRLPSEPPTPGGDRDRAAVARTDVVIADPPMVGRGAATCA